MNSTESHGIGHAHIRLNFSPRKIAKTEKPTFCNNSLEFGPNTMKFKTNARIFNLIQCYEKLSKRLKNATIMNDYTCS